MQTYCNIRPVKRECADVRQLEVAVFDTFRYGYHLVSHITPPTGSVCPQTRRLPSGTHHELLFGHLPQCESDEDEVLEPGSEADHEQIGNFILNQFSRRVHDGCAFDSHLSALVKKGTITAKRQGPLTLYWAEGNRLYVPDADDLRYECFQAGHCHPYSGHYGVIRTYKKLAETFFWPRMREDVQRWIHTCDSCQRVKAVRQKPAGLLQPLEIPEKRWQSVSMDFITDLPATSRGKDTILVVVDRLSKMVHLIPMNKIHG